MRGRIVSAAICTIVLSVFAVLPSVATTWTVSVGDDFFSPQNITIATGDVVHWVWAAGSHTTTSGDNCTPNGMWTAPIDSNHQTFSFTFATNGTYNYFCIPHCTMGMVGSVFVQDASGVRPSSSGRPAVATLSISPNPFHPFTTVVLNLPRAGSARVAVFDAAGREIISLANGSFAAGPHSLVWHGENAAGTAVPDGLYFVRSWTGDGNASATLIKLR